MPNPTPSPSPTPGAFANQTAQTNQFYTSIAERLPGINQLPPDVRPFVISCLDLAMLALTFLIVRAIITRSVESGVSKLAQREEAAGNIGRAARVRTLAGLTASIIMWLVGFLFVVSALSVLGVNVLGLVSTAGVAGLAFGFGAQKLVKDVITGFFILLEDQYAVGDYVTINSITGTVEELVMRTTRIRDDDGKLYILSNGDIAQVCNQSRGPVAGTFEIAVAASADPRKAEEVLNEALARVSDEIQLAKPAKVDGISQADANKTTFKMSFRVAHGTRPGPAVLRLRDAARTALLEAQIPLAPP